LPVIIWSTEPAAYTEDSINRSIFYPNIRPTTICNHETG
jgi:hypothetical protein